MKTKWKLVLALAVTVLWLWFIYSRSLSDGDASHDESSAVLEWLRRYLPFVTMTMVRKAAHVFEFGVLGVLLYLDWRLLGRSAALVPLGAGLVFAAADEFLQTFVPARSGEVLDVLIDLCGVAAGVGAGLLLRKWKEGRGRGEGRNA